MMQVGGRPGRDPIARIGMMVVRLGFVVAAVVGFGRLFGVVGGMIEVHMWAGIFVLLGIWVAALRFTIQKRPSLGPVWGAAALSLVGAALGLAGGYRTLHLVCMVLAVGLAEMGVARASKG